MNRSFLTFTLATLVCGIGVAENTKRIQYEGLPSKSNSFAIRIEGCKPERVEVDGEELIEQGGLFVSAFNEVLPGDALLEVAVPATCKKIKLSEQKTEQLSQDEDLPPAVKKEPAPPTPTDGETAQEAPVAINGAPSGGLRFQQARGASIQVPGRVNQSAYNQTVDSAVQDSGRTIRKDYFNNNVGTNINVQRRGGTVIKRSNRLQADDIRVRTSQRGKGGTSTSDTPADAAHSQFDSHNRLAGSTVANFGNTETFTSASGNIGGNVTIVDEINNRVEEDNELLAAPAPKVENVTINKNTYVTPTYYRPAGYYWYNGVLWYQAY